MKIFILDSGIGGLSILKPLKEKYKNLVFEYYADNKNCPYGEKSEEEILKIVLDAVDRMSLSENDILILACNTASVVAIDKVKEVVPCSVFGVLPNVEYLNLLYDKTLFLGKN